MTNSRTCGLLALGLVACGAEAVAPEGRMHMDGPGDLSDEGGLFPNAEWNAVAALAALGSGNLTLRYRGPIHPGEAWVDPETEDVITVEAQAALLTAPTFFVVPSDSVPSDIETADRLTMVALAFADAHGKVSLQPGLRPAHSLDGGPTFPVTGKRAQIIIAGKKKGDGFDPDGATDFDLTDHPPGSVQQHSDLPDEDVGDADADGNADQWEPTEDADPENLPPGTEEFDIDDDTQDELDKMWEDHQKKKNEPN